MGRAYMFLSHNVDIVICSDNRRGLADLSRSRRMLSLFRSRRLKMSLWSRGLNKVKEVVAEVNVDILTRCSVRGGVGTLFRIRIWCGIWDWQRYRGFTLCGSQVQRVPIHAWSSWNCVMLALQAPCETSAQLAL
ncbi:hypothetical protein V6N11_028323 [Hibiscus sabdariffa]